ncbi:hypothetical protein D3C73_1283680 [compost metagenome]
MLASQSQAPISAMPFFTACGPVTEPLPEAAIFTFGCSFWNSLAACSVSGSSAVEPLTVILPLRLSAAAAIPAKDAVTAMTAVSAVTVNFLKTFMK